MTNRIGLWIDHKTAVIVTVDEKGTTVKKIESGAIHHEFRGATHPKTAYSAQYSKGEDQLDQKFIEHLNKYYEQVIALLRGADSILIFGPGEAKSELSKRLARAKGAGPEIRIEAADKMTDRQIVAKVRKHFGDNGSGSA
jgi:stalled ribosome rescue protein Dom34